MSKPSLFLRLFTAVPSFPDSHPANDAAPQTIPFVEALERRLVPSATVATGDFNRDGTDDIAIKVNDPGAHVTITENDAAGTTTVQIDGPNPFSQVFNEIFDGVKVKLTGTGERLDYLLASDAQAVQHDYIFKLGAAGTGNVINFDAQGHSIFDSDIALRVAGGTGNNVVNVLVDRVDHSGLGIKLIPAGPNNAVNVRFFGDVANDSDVATNILVGPGANAGGNVIDVRVLGATDHSTLRIHTDGSDDPTGTSGDDTVSYTLAGAVNHGGLLDVSMNLVNGRDSGSVEVAQGTFAVLDHSVAYVTLEGGQKSDNLSVNSDGGAGTIPIDHSSTLDIAIAGGNGADTITSDFSNVNAFHLDGELILLVTGGTNNDNISVGLANTADSAGLYDVTLRGDQDNDRFTVFIDDPSNGAVGYDSSDGGAFDYPTGYAIVAGGSGYNTADVFGNVALINIQQG